MYNFRIKKNWMEFWYHDGNYYYRHHTFLPAEEFLEGYKAWYEYGQRSA